MSLSYVSCVSKHGLPDGQKSNRKLPRVMARHNRESLLELPGLEGRLPIHQIIGLSLSDILSLQKTSNGNLGNDYGAHTNEILDRFRIYDRFQFLYGFNDDAHYGSTLVRRAYGMVQFYIPTVQSLPPSQHDRDVFIAVTNSLHRDGEFLTKAIIEHVGIDNLPEAVRNGLGSNLRLFQKELYYLINSSIH